MKVGSGTIETFGNRCFVDRGFPFGERSVVTEKTPPERVPIPKTKPEKVNLKFGKIRVQVTSAKKVRVRQDDNTLVIFLSEDC